MKFTPKTDSDIEQEAEERKAKYQPWPAGTICDYEIICATDKMTKEKIKDGNTIPPREMIEIDVEVYNDKGEKKTLMDWLGEWSDQKTKNICEAGGILDVYNKGEIVASDLYHKTGKCRVGIQKGGDNGNGGKYPDKNNITDYLKTVVGSKPKSKVETENDLNDSIPFTWLLPLGLAGLMFLQGSGMA